MSKIQKISLSAVFAAMIFSLTMIHIGIGPIGGYVHLGDAMIFLCAVCLPTPYAVLASAIGACLADTVSGAVVYIIPTAIIKIASALCFSSKTKKIVSARNIIACILSAILCVGGYYIAEVIILGFDLVVPLASVPFNLIQAVSSIAIFLVLGAVFDKTNLRNKFIK